MVHTAVHLLLGPQEYPDYYQLISQPIALSMIRKRVNTHQYKNVLEFRDDFKLMFSNARRYNQEGSWVYIDAEEMEKAFDAAFERVVVGSSLPSAPAFNGNSSTGGSALTPMDEDERLPPKSKTGRKQIISDDEYLTNPSDEE